jgi:site-specific DNA recombinase
VQQVASFKLQEKYMKELKYVLYARKSSEGNERQVQSIDDQTREMQRLAASYGLNIVAIEYESKSAKAPYVRPVFERVMKMIQSGEANAILCWSVDRLSRNAVDSGLISHLLQNEIIKEIRTYSRQYLPTDNALVLSVDTGSANQYVRDLSVNTKRGLNSKVEKGHYPGTPPAGYKNDLLTQTIVIDEERSPLIREAFDMMLAGGTINDTMRYLNEVRGYRSIQHKHSGGNKMIRTTLYNILTNPFYTGYFRWHGELKEGHHKPIITYKEHQTIVSRLRKEPSPRPKGEKVSLAYRGMMKCGECDCMITGEIKLKKGKAYTYYHCTHRKPDVICKQPAVTDAALEEQICSELNKYNIHPKFLKWAEEALSNLDKKEAEDSRIKIRTQSMDLESINKELSELLRMRTKGLIDDNEYSEQKRLLVDELELRKAKMKAIKQNPHKGAKQTLTLLNFINKAQSKFKNGSDSEKKELLTIFGQKLVLEDKKLKFSPVSWLIPIQEGYSDLERQFLTLEPANNRNLQIENNKKTSEEVLKSSWLRRLDSNQQPRS